MVHANLNPRRLLVKWILPPSARAPRHRVVSLVCRSPRHVFSGLRESIPAPGVPTPPMHRGARGRGGELYIQHRKVFCRGLPVAFNMGWYFTTCTWRVGQHNIGYADHIACGNNTGLPLCVCSSSCWYYILRSTWGYRVVAQQLSEGAARFAGEYVKQIKRDVRESNCKFYRGTAVLHHESQRGKVRVINLSWTYIWQWRPRAYRTPFSFKTELRFMRWQVLIMYSTKHCYRYNNSQCYPTVFKTSAIGALASLRPCGCLTWQREAAVAGIPLCSTFTRLTPWHIFASPLLRISRRGPAAFAARRSCSKSPTKMNQDEIEVKTGFFCFAKQKKFPLRYILTTGVKNEKPGRN